MRIQRVRINLPLTLTPPDKLRRAALGTGAAASTALWLGGCSIEADHDHRDPLAPSMVALARVPRTAWVLGSGGPRGFAHVGVLLALAQLQLRPDVIVGASIGSLVAVLAASGMSAADMQDLALRVQPWQFARLNITQGEMLTGSGVAQFVRDRLFEHSPDLGPLPLLQSLKLPVVCVAHRVADGAAVAFNQGDAGLAVQAACAIEGQFTPVRIRGQRHVDADLHMPLPVRVARVLGATRVLAVDVSAFEDKAPSAAASYRAGDLRKRALTQPDAALADVLLRPDFGYWVNLSREFRQRAIDAGYRATMAASVHIRALHAAS